MQACTAAGYNRRQSLQDLGRMKLKSFLVQVLLPVTFSLALVSSSEAFSLPPLLSPPRAQNFWCKNPPSAQSCPLRTPFHRRTSHVQLHMKEDDQNGQPLSAAMRSGQIFWQDGYPVHDSSITSLVDSLHECDRRLRQRRWQVGSPLSLATLLLAFGSISIIGDLLGIPFTSHQTNISSCAFGGPLPTAANGIAFTLLTCRFPQDRKHLHQWKASHSSLPRSLSSWPAFLPSAALLSRSSSELPRWPTSPFPTAALSLPSSAASHSRPQPTLQDLPLPHPPLPVPHRSASVLAGSRFY